MNEPHQIAVDQIVAEAREKIARAKQQRKEKRAKFLDKIRDSLGSVIRQSALSPTETAVAFGRSPTWAYRRIYDGTFRVISSGGRLMIPRDEIERFIARADKYDPQPKNGGEELMHALIADDEVAHASKHDKLHCVCDSCKAWRSERTPSRAAHASEQDVIERLEYIAQSPPSQHGGFHEEAIQTAKDAIACIRAAWQAGYTECLSHDIKALRSQIDDAIKELKAMSRTIVMIRPGREPK